MPLYWDASRHALGLTLLDGAHEQFTLLVRALNTAGDAEFPALFAALIAHTSEHFSDEGRLMRESKYSGLAMHEAEHHRKLGELQQLGRTLKRGHLPLVRAFVREGLPEWFESHLATMDLALIAHLRKSV